MLLGCLFGLLLFEKVEVDKLAASHSESAEIYVLGLRYKAPAKIDPRLLDVKHLFQGSAQPDAKVNCFGGCWFGNMCFCCSCSLICLVVESLMQVVDVLRDNKQKRHRDG